MVRIPLGEFDPTAETPSWAASLDKCCVVKDPRRKKKREVNERGAAPGSRAVQMNRSFHA
jgi:hypothetical protein